MRTKRTRQEYFNFSQESRIKIVNQYREQYEAINEILEANPVLVDLAHQDFSKLVSKSKKGRRGRYTSEQMLRAVVVMNLEKAVYREATIRVENSEFLRSFVKLGIEQPMMDFTFVCKAYGVLGEKTWQAINRALGRYGRENKQITGERLRLDTTAYETNIHWPTESSLLWDGYRTLARLMKQVRREMMSLGIEHRFHVKKIKKLAQQIARNGGSGNKGTQRRVKQIYTILIERAEWISGIAEQVATVLRSGDLEAMATAAELERYVPLVKRVALQARRRVLQGESVPAGEKVYSIFEEHTELLKRGKAGKPIEFGHKVLVAESKEKFIVHYQALEKQTADKNLLDPTLAAHRRLFGQEPDVLATDKGFYESREQLARLGATIETVSIGKKGRRTAAETARETSKAFKAGQRFRAGSEGTISVLKRAFSLGRCLFKGFKHYAASVGCAIFCHNLVVLARL